VLNRGVSKYTSDNWLKIVPGLEF